MKTHNNVAVIGVLHPGILPFIDNYLSSLEEQTYQNFDLLLANDNVLEVMSILKDRSLNWNYFDITGSPASIRKKLLTKVLSLGYEKLIFTDCDDFFMQNRVENCIELLDSHSIVVNDLDVVASITENSIDNYFYKRFMEGQEIFARDILTGNLLGLSNTSVRSEVFNDNFSSLCGDVVAFDWYLWTSVLNQGYTAKFTGRTKTYYRVYDGNTAGLPQIINESNLKRGVEIKLRHYSLTSKQGIEYENMHKEFLHAHQMMYDDKWKSKYLQSLKEHETEFPLWWENIRSPVEVGML